MKNINNQKKQPNYLTSKFHGPGDALPDCFDTVDKNEEMVFNNKNGK